MYAAVGDVDNGRRNGVLDIAEHIPRCDSEYYKEPRTIADVEKYVLRPTSGSPGYKESKDPALEKHKK